MKWLRPVVPALLLHSIMTLAGPSSHAAAQTFQDQVEQLNREAMEAYNELNINKAGQLLERADQLAMEGGLAGRVVAITKMNLGIVYIGGLGDQQGGLAHFLAAVCHDPSIELDPLVSTPDMQLVYGQAQLQAQQGACGAGGAPPPGAAAGVMQPQVAVQPIVHMPPPEQQTQTPLPVYVEVAPNLGAVGVNLYYKGLGMDSYKRVPMYALGQGMAYQITCNDVFEPAVSYYIEAVGGGGQPVATVGNAQVPIQVAVVGHMPQLPAAFPGYPNPASCVTGECPPGVACAESGTAAIGEDCTQTTDCQSGLVCSSDDACVIDGAGGTEVNSGDEWEGDSGGKGERTTRFFAQVGFALGMAYVDTGKPADRLPPINRIFVDENSDGAWVMDPRAAMGATLRLPAPEEGSFPGRLTAWVPDADSGDAAFLDYSGDCAADGVATGPGQASVLPSSYCVRVANPGFAATTALRLNVGYYLTDRFAPSVVVRFQLGAGEGTLSNMLLGLRGEYLLTTPGELGLAVSLFGGFTFGQIQVQPAFEGEPGVEDPFIQSGLMGFHLGPNIRYMIMDNFGVFVAPELDLQFPDSLINLDLPIGVEVAL